MLQRGTMPPVSAQAAELTESWQQSLQGDWPALIRAAARLPSTGREFLFYCLALVAIAGALSVHVLISVQILGARLEIDRLENEIERVERVNSEVAYATSLLTSADQMTARAESLGFAYTTEREYVALSADHHRQDPAVTPLSGEAPSQVAPLLPAPAASAAGAASTLRIAALSDLLPPRTAFQARYQQGSRALREWGQGLGRRAESWMLSLRKRILPEDEGRLRSLGRNGFAPSPP